MRMESAGYSGGLQSSSGGGDRDRDRDDDDTHEFHSPPRPSVDPLISSFFQFTHNNSSSSYQLLMTTNTLDRHPPPPLHHMSTNMSMNDSLSLSHFSFSQLPPAAPTATASAPISHVRYPSPSPSPSPPTPSPPSTSSSRKRTRASRRVPTTVLTTDTSNFRAMVQEFTGIPAPPFSPPSSSHHHHLHLHLLRPFAHKLNTTSTTPATATATALQTPFTTTIDALHTSDDQAHGQSSTLLNMPNSSQLLSFQSLLQSQHLIQPNYDPRRPASAAHALLGSSDTLQQGGWPGTASGSVSAPADGADMPDPESIQRSDYAAAAAAVSTQQQHVHDRQRERAAAAASASSSCKLNSSTAGSSSEFVNVNVSIREQDARVDVAGTQSRGEGTVDSWLCSSSSDHR